jgi:hypothetical protein
VPRSDTIERDTSVHGPSGDPDALLGTVIEGQVLMPEVIVQARSAGLGGGIRLNHLNNERHDIKKPHEEGWYSFNGYTLIIDTGDPDQDEIEASWIEDLIGRHVIKRDDLPSPVECLVCKGKGQLFTTKCLPLYARHMQLEHA